MSDKEYLDHYKKMRSSYKKKLKQLKTFGTANRIPERIKETEDSIKLLDTEIERLIIAKKKHKKVQNENCN